MHDAIRSDKIASVLMFAAALSAGLAVHASAQDRQTETRRKPAESLPGKIDLDRSRVYVKVGATGFGHPHGVEGRVKSGNLVVKEGAASGQLVFDLASFQADSNLARKAVGLKGETAGSTAKQVTDNMLGSDVLDTDHFPTATFTLESATRPAPPSDQGGDVYELAGKLVLHGVTRPLKFRVRAIAEKGSSRFTGSFKLRQTDFGITPFSKALGAIGVADELTIIGDLWLSPPGGQVRPEASPR